MNPLPPIPKPTHSSVSASPVAAADLPEAVTADQFDEIDAILDELRTRYDETPQWEFCEGFLAALICCRRPIGP